MTDLSRRPAPRRALAALGALLFAASASAFDLIGSSWSNGNIVMQLQLGATPGTLIDGATDWATVAESALNEWNAQITRCQFTTVRNSTAVMAQLNRLNNVFFSPNFYGSAFDARTLAVTLGSTSTATGRSVEKDVIFNSNKTWNSYRGTLRSGLSEFRRVALHEFGHVLGLDHPDEAEPLQFVAAIMNSTISSAIETLQPDDIAGAKALYAVTSPSATPTIAAHPQSRTVLVGGSYTFSVTVNGAGPFTYSWGFRPKGTTTTESFRLATGPSYTIGSVQTADAGAYVVIVSSSAGIVVSNEATLTVTPVTTSSDTALANISTRGVVSSGSGVLIAGLVIGGTTPKNILLRAVGPALTDFGVADALADPTLTLFGPNSSTLIAATNDNWDTGPTATTAALVATATRLGAFQFTPGSKDAALLATLPPGNYSAIVSGPGATTGVALVEAYDADANAATARTRHLLNIATRGQVGSGDNVLIAGLVLTGPGPRTYLIRAVGPTLADPPFNVPGALLDPFLQIYQGEAILHENDDWDAPTAGRQALRDAAIKVGAFALREIRNSVTRSGLDSVLLLTLAPGTYTAKVSGFEGATGVALIEIYEMPP
ncbi:MAG: matrixin family metalloprotease [Opitutus sp.]|nr:matrixin family metalloprotease [Opitutus sp.]